jgi:hypothetical protein
MQVCGGHGYCLGAVSTYCECYTGYSGSACAQCAGGYLFRGGWCVFPPGALSTGSCSDGVRNGDEDGVDCGGECAAACTVMNNHGAGGSVSVPGVTGPMIDKHTPPPHCCFIALCACSLACVLTLPSLVMRADQCCCGCGKRPGRRSSCGCRHRSSKAPLQRTGCSRSYASQPLWLPWCHDQRR